MNWVEIKNITTSIQNGMSSIAILVGAIWVYSRFVKFRTLKPKLEFEITADKFTNDNNHVTLITRVRIFNRGNAKVDLTRERHRCYLRYALLETGKACNTAVIVSKPNRDLAPIDNMFVEHTTIEPSEVIDDVKVILIPFGNWGAIQLEVAIWGYYTAFFRRHLRRYSAATAIQISGTMVCSSFTSEDDQSNMKNGKKE